MEKKCIILDPETFAIRLDIDNKVKPNEIVIVSHDEIIKILPESVRTSPVIEAVYTIIAGAIDKLCSVDIPMVGVGRLKLVLEENLAGPANQSVKQFLLSKLEQETLSTRLYGCIKHKFEYWYELVAWESEEFLRILNFGKKSLDELEKFLKKKGLSPDIRAKIQEKARQLETVRLKDIPELMGNESFKNFLNETTTIYDFSGESAGRIAPWDHSLRYSSIAGEMFPYRGNPDSVPENKLTPYEKKFKVKDSREKIESFLEESQKVIWNFYCKEMEKFITEM